MHLMRRLLPLLALALSGAAAAAELEAQLEWLPAVALSTPVEGRVDEVRVLEGQALKHGELLLKLDERPFRIELARRKAELEGFDVRFEEVEREWDRAQELFERDLISDHDLELARIAYAEAEAARAALVATLQQAELMLEYSHLKAPFDAWLVQRQVEPGELVVNGERVQTLLTIVPRGRLAARAVITAEQAAALAVGTKLPLRYEGQRLEGRVLSLGMSPDESGRYPLVVEFAADGAARPAGAATLLLP